jgi:hypothetical protein
MERAAHFFDRKLEICSALKKKSLILILIIFCLLIYSFSLLTTSVELGDSNEVICAPIKRWLDLVKLMSLFDSILAILLPFGLILISNTMVGFKLIDHSNRFSMNSRLNIYHRQKPISKVKNISKMTKLLFIISSTFLLLNMPIALGKIWSFYRSYDSHQNSIKMTKRIQDTSEESSQTLNEEILERISFYLYYLNFSINFFLFTINESKFRERIWTVLKSKPNYHKPEAKKSTKLNTVKITML